jgi:short-subunit dehydrogenase
VAPDELQLKKVNDEFKNYGVQIHPLPMDFCEPTAAKEVYDFTCQMNIKVDALINDAGQREVGKSIETDLKRQLDIIELNVISLVSLTHYFLKDMISRNGGKILQLDSEVSKTSFTHVVCLCRNKSICAVFFRGNYQ